MREWIGKSGCSKYVHIPIVPLSGQKRQWESSPAMKKRWWCLRNQSERLDSSAHFSLELPHRRLFDLQFEMSRFHRTPRLEKSRLFDTSHLLSAGPGVTTATVARFWTALARMNTVFEGQVIDALVGSHRSDLKLLGRGTTWSKASFRKYSQTAQLVQSSRYPRFDDGTALLSGRLAAISRNIDVLIVLPRKIIRPRVTRRYISIWGYIISCPVSWIRWERSRKKCIVRW
jgi:hypothetical protein